MPTKFGTMVLLSISCWLMYTVMPLFLVFTSTGVPTRGSVLSTMPLDWPMGTGCERNVGISPKRLHSFAASARVMPERSGILMTCTPLLTVRVIFALSFTILGLSAVWARGYWSHTVPAGYSSLYSSSKAK